MITILRGEEPLVRSQCLQHFQQSDRPIWIEPSQSMGRYWDCFRQLVPKVRSFVGDQPVDDVLFRHRVIASLVLGRLRDDLSPQQSEELEQISARLNSHLSHNWFLDKPVLHGLAAIVAELSASSGFKVFIPNLTAADSVTLALLVAVHRRFPDHAPDMVVGYAPGLENRVVDQYGLAWGLTKEDVRELVSALHAIPGSRFLDVSEPASAQDNGRPKPRLDRWDDDPDGEANQVLESSSELLQPEQIRIVLQGASRAFQAFSRDVSLRLALGLMERKPDLDREQSATLHTLLGLSAHNWQFDSQRENTRLTSFLEGHFRKALDLEDRLSMQLALYYRLAVTLGRRKQDFDAALEFADRGLARAESVGLSRWQKLYQSIWLRNIRAYLYMRRKEMDKAFEDSNACIEMVQELIESSEEVSRDVKFTRTTVFDNNQALCWITKREDRLYERARKNMELLEQDPESFGGRFSAGPWLFLYRDKHRLDLAIKAAHFGLQDSQPDFIHFAWFYLMQLGDLYYRQGDTAKSLSYFEKTKPLRKHLRKVRNLAFLPPALAALRGGKLHLAEEQLQQALSHPSTESEATKAELLAAMALVSAHKGDARQSEARINQAIDLATRNGVRDNLLEVARTAGNTAQVLGRTDEAREAFQQMLEIAAVQGDFDPPPGCLVAALLGLAKCGVEDPHLMQRAVRLMPAALKDDGEAWWDLPRILPRIAASLEETIDPESEPDRQALIAIITAASQRPDCAAALGDLHKRLPSSVYQESMTL